MKTRNEHRQWAWRFAQAGFLFIALAAAAQAQPAPAPANAPAAEVRGTWLTTTANRAIATPQDTAQTMRRLREIGLNTVYVEAWKNGYTQWPSEVLRRTIGVARRPAAALQDPSDEARQQPARDLLGETLTAAHREGLVYIAWFEYGFMAAHQGTMNHLRRLKPDWLSRDAQGSEVAPNGFVWLNPLHPQARRFLTDLVLEAIEQHDLDGIQLDDRLVWPHVTMGYDAHTRQAYAAEHGGRQPPANPRDAAWMRWRADKLNTLAREFVAELRAKRPGLVLSLSPAVYPWSFENYLLEWPQWAKWPAPAHWDEIVPQAYRTSYAAFESTWLAQIGALKAAGAYRPQRLLAGIRLVGEGADSSWAQLRDSIGLSRAQGNGGHVHWFSRGVLELFSAELQQHYGGAVASPRFPAHWRPPPRPLQRQLSADGSVLWRASADTPAGRYRVIGWDGQQWRELQERWELRTHEPAANALRLPAGTLAAELLVDRRQALNSPMICRDDKTC